MILMLEFKRYAFVGRVERRTKLTVQNRHRPRTRMTPAIEIGDSVVVTTVPAVGDIIIIIRDGSGTVAVERRVTMTVPLTTTLASVATE